MSSDKEPPAIVSFTLLENGLDFVLSAVEYLSGTLSKRELKYAVLHLYSGAVQDPRRGQVLQSHIPIWRSLVFP